jgi:hypothetical protein
MTAFSVEEKLHRLSPNQLKALLELAKAEKGIIESTLSGQKIGVNGKPLGGLFSSLSRQKILGKNLIIPWGKASNGRGLRWKLNTELISLERLKEVINILLNDY